MQSRDRDGWPVKLGFRVKHFPGDERVRKPYGPVVRIREDARHGALIEIRDELTQGTHVTTPATCRVMKQKRQTRSTRGWLEEL